jgi:F-type H+-transporting ATPase subunit epsilon
MSFQCTIVTPEEQTFDATVNGVVLPAHDGMLGILTGHSPLLVQLGVGTFEAEQAGAGRRRFVIDGGVAQMCDNRLTVLTGYAAAADTVDVAAVKAELAAAEARDPKDAAGKIRKASDISRAKAKLQVAGAA